jgi:hypothetical protein
MRSPRERALWTALAVALAAAAGAAWWTADQWLPHAGPWLERSWRSSTRPGPDSLPPERRAASAQASADAASAPATQARKCLQGGRTVYTDQPCPSGSAERPLEGALTVLPPQK